MEKAKKPDPMIELRGYLKSVKELWAWAAGAAVIPFLANFAKLAPPWPPAIVYITAVLELVALIWAFQTVRKKSHKEVNSQMFKSLITMVICLVSYLFLFSLFTYQVLGTDIVIVKGFVCTPVAIEQFANCPWLVGEDIRLAEYDPNLLWSLPSITIVRLSIVSLWIGIFFFLSLFLGSFLAKLRS